MFKLKEIFDFRKTIRLELSKFILKNNTTVVTTEFATSSVQNFGKMDDIKPTLVNNFW